MATPAVLELIFSAKTDGAKKAMSELDGSAKQAGQSAGQAGSKMQGALDGLAAKAGIPKGLTASFGAMGTAAVAATGAVAGIAIAAKGLYEAVQAAEGFEAAMQEVASLQIPEVAADFENLRSQVSELAATMGVDAVDAATATYNALSAGIPAAEVLDFLQASATGAVGGLSSLADAGSVTATIMNTFGAEAGSAQDIIDTLFGTVKAGVTTFPELAASMGNVATNAAAANVTLPQTAAALASLTQQGLTTSKASTALNQAFIELQKPGEALSKALGDVTLAGDGLDAVLEQLGTAADDAGKPVSLFFGSAEAGAAVMALASDEAGKYTAALEGIENSSGAANAAMEIINNSWARQKELLSSQVMGALREVGLYLLDGLTPALTAVNNWLEQYLPAATSVLIGALKLVASTFRVVFGVAVAIIKPFWDFWAGFLAGFGASSDHAFQKFAIIVKFAWTVLQTFGKVAWSVFKAVSSVIFQVFRGAGKVLGSFFGQMNKVSGSGLANALRGFRDFAKGVLNFVGTMAERGAELFGRFIGFIVEKLGFLARIPIIGELIGNVSASVGGALEGVQSAVSAGTAAIDAAADSAYNSLKELENAAFEITLEEPSLNAPPDFGAGVASEAAAAGAGAGEKAGKAAGKAASSAAKGATEKMMADLAKAMSEAFVAGLRAIREILGTDLPELEEIMPKIKILEDFATELGLAIQRIGRALNPDETGADIAFVKATTDALKGVIDTFKAAAGLVADLADMAEPNLDALRKLTPLLKASADEFLSIAKWTELEAEAVKLFADALKPVVDVLKTAATLDLGKVTAITEDQLRIAHDNIAGAATMVYALTEQWRELSATAQEEWVKSLALFSAAVGSVVETLKAVASFNLHGITEIAEQDLETASENLLQMARTVWELSAGWRDLVADAQVKIVEDITRFAASVKAVADTLGAIASFQVEEVSELTVEVMDALKANVMSMAALVWQISGAFRELSPQVQQDMLDDFKRFAGTVAEMVKTLKSILEIPVPNIRIENSNATAVFNTAFGWTRATIEAFAEQSRMLIRWLEEALRNWSEHIEPKSKAFAALAKPVIDVLKNLLEVPAPNVRIENDPATAVFNTAWGWTMATVQAFAEQARMLVGWIEDALGSWQPLEGKAGELADLVGDVIDLIENILEIPTPPSTGGSVFGSIAPVRWTQEIVDSLVADALRLVGMVEEAIKIWQGKVNPRVEEMADALGATIDLVDELLNLPLPTSALGAQGPTGMWIAPVEWTQEIIDRLIEAADELIGMVNTAVSKWQGTVNPRVKEMADALQATVDLLAGAISLSELDMTKLVPVDTSLVELAAENIRLVIDRLAAVVGEAEGQVSTEMLEKARALAEAFAPVQEVLGGIGDTIRALMENPFAKASSRLRGASNSVQFGQMIDGNAFQKRLIDSIQASITTLLSALAGITIPADLGDRFKPLKDAADAIKAAMEALAGISLPENLDAILAAARQLAGFGGGGGGLGTFAVLPGGGEGNSVPPGEVLQRIIDAVLPGGGEGNSLPPGIAFQKVIDAVLPGGGEGNRLPPGVAFQQIIDAVLPGGGEGNSIPPGGGGFGTFGTGGGFGGLQLAVENATIQNAIIPNLALSLNFTIGAQKFAAASVEGFQVDTASVDKLIQIIDRRRAQTP